MSSLTIPATLETAVLFKFIPYLYVFILLALAVLVYWEYKRSKWGPRLKLGSRRRDDKR